MVKDLTKGQPLKLIVTFMLSMLVASIMSYVYSTTDSLMASWFVSPDALGAISSASPAYDLISGFASTTISGFSIFVGNIFGAGDLRKLRNVIANAVYLTVILTGFATLICVIFCRTFVLWMNTPDSFVDMATSYLSIVMFGMPISAVSWLYGGMFRALGDSKTPVYVSAISGLSNVVFNALFMGVFQLGIAGAAYGTVCANAVSAVLMLLLLKKRMNLLIFGKSDMKVSFPTIKILLSNGIPLGLMTSVVSIGSMILQIALNGHGEAVVTGVYVGGRVLSLFWMFFINFENAIVYFGAQNMGAGQVSRIRTGVRQTLFLCLGIGAVCTALAFPFAKYIFMLFAGNDAAILDVAQQYLFTQIAFFPFMVTLTTWRGGLKGLGNTIPAVLCGVIELICRVVVSFCFSDNRMILFFAGPAAWVFASVFLAILYPRTLKKRERQHSAIENQQNPVSSESAVPVVEKA